MPRLKIESVYMEIAYSIAKLSYAERRKVGCVIVKDQQIVSFGYNGTPHGFDNACESHAESNALSKLAKSTMSSEGATLYTTTAPCFECSKLIIQSGINKVYYNEGYRDMGGVELLNKANINVIETDVIY